MSHVARIIYANIKDIVPNPLNPREDISVRTEDMQRIPYEKGWESPITCYQKDTKYVILSGHRRWYAAKKLSQKQIPVFLVQAPSSPLEELERLGSVQGGKIDWSVYEWAKYTYEMWIFWKECSYRDLARKLNKSNRFVRTRVNIFRYYNHNEIEGNLMNGLFSISILDFLIKWLDTLSDLKPDIIKEFSLELIRTTMLSKIERKHVTIIDLKNDSFIRRANSEQIKDFLTKPNKKLCEALAELGSGYEKYKGKSKINTCVEVINNIRTIIETSPPPESKEEYLHLQEIINSYNEILTNKKNEIELYLV